MYHRGMLGPLRDAGPAVGVSPRRGALPKARPPRPAGSSRTAWPRRRRETWRRRLRPTARRCSTAPRFAEAHDRLGFVLGQLNRTDEAIDEFRLAISQDPKLFDAQYHLGATLWWTGDAAACAGPLAAAVRAPAAGCGRALLPGRGPARDRQGEGRGRGAAGGGRAGPRLCGGPLPARPRARGLGRSQGLARGARQGGRARPQERRRAERPRHFADAERGGRARRGDAARARPRSTPSAPTSRRTSGPR